MRLLLFAGCVALLSGCKLPEPRRADDPEPLHGNWLITSIKHNGNVPDVWLEKMDSITTHIELCSISFNSDNQAVVDDWYAAPEATSWKLVGNMLKVHTRKITPDQQQPVFSIMQLQKGVMRLQYAMPSDVDSLRLYYLLRKLEPSDSLMDIFSKEANVWRKKPAAPETNEQIKQRTISMAEYYAAYFDVMLRNEAPYFNNNKLLIPLIFYNGGLELKEMPQADNWKRVYYNEADAAKAHDMLRRAFYRFGTYPSRGDEFVKEYVAALRILASKLREL